jgi:hypothetical protein
VKHGQLSLPEHLITPLVSSNFSVYNNTFTISFSLTCHHMFMIHSNKFLFRICSTCRKHFRSFPHSWLIIRFVFRVTRRVPLVGQEPFTLPEHLSAPAGVRVTRSLVLCLILCRSLFDFLSLFIWSLCCLSCDLRILITSLVYCSHCVVCPVIYAFWLPLWYIVVIVLSVLWFTHSDYLFGIL